MVYISERSDLDQPTKLYALSIANPPLIGWLNSIGIQLTVLIAALATTAGFYGKTLGYQQFEPLANFGWFAVITSVIFHTLIIVGNFSIVLQIKNGLEGGATKVGIDSGLLKPMLAKNLHPGSRSVGLRLFAKIMVILRVVNIVGLASLGYTVLPLLGVIAYGLAWSSNKSANDHVVDGVRRLANQPQPEVNAPSP